MWRVWHIQKLTFWFKKYILTPVVAEKNISHVFWVNPVHTSLSVSVDSLSHIQDLTMAKPPPTSLSCEKSSDVSLHFCFFLRLSLLICVDGPLYNARHVSPSSNTDYRGINVNGNQKHRLKGQPQSFQLKCQGAKGPVRLVTEQAWQLCK